MAYNIFGINLLLHWEFLDYLLTILFCLMSWESLKEWSERDNSLFAAFEDQIK